MPAILEIKISLVSIKTFLGYCHLCYTRGVISIIPWFILYIYINIYILYLYILYLYILYIYIILSARNADLFIEVIIAMFYFCHLENPSNIMKDIFNSISIYS